MTDAADPMAEISARLRAARPQPNGHDPNGFLPLLELETEEIVPPFPVAVLPPPFGDRVFDVADRMQVPPEFVAIPLLVGAGAMLGKAVRLTPKRHDDWTERACLWGAVVAPPSLMKKTPATQQALRPLNKMQAEAWQRYEVALKEWKRLERSEAGADHGEEPRPDTLVVNDPTVEQLVRLMQREPRGFMLYRDELSAWLLGMDKYRARGGDDRQFYLQCWSGGQHRVDRVGKEPLYVHDLYLPIFGTMQPGIMQKILRGGDLDGMTARIGLLAYPAVPDSVDVVDRRPNHEARAAVEQRLRDIRNVDREEPLRFSGEAYALFNDWLLRNVNRREESAAFAAHIAKYQGLFPRLALTLHFMRHTEPAPDEVGVATARAVQTLIDDYLEPHARKVYGVLSAHPARAGAIKIAQWLRKAGSRVKTFTAREVRQKNWTEFKVRDDGKTIADVMNFLEAHGWIALVEPTTTRGRPAKLLAKVNPAAWERQ